jgi:electron transfer flavoprotein beta subunit
MRDSETVVTINPDSYAPIVEIADLALVGDVNEVLPPLLERLRQIAQPPSIEEQSSSLEPTSEEAWRGEGVRCIAVCLSRCLDPEARFDARNPEEINAIRRVLNPADSHALEEALSLKDRFPSLRVVALHVGPPAGEAVLRQALARGADDAILLWDEAFANSDSLVTARVLAAAIRRLEAQIILCGNRGSDGQSGQLPLQIGELLGATAMSNVLALSVEKDERATVQQRREWGKRAVISCLLPAVLAMDPGINRPRYPRLRNLLWAQVRPVNRWGRAELGLKKKDVGETGSAIQVLRVGPPKPVAKRQVATQADIPTSQRWQQSISGGGASSQRAKIVQGSPDQLAEACFRFLLERGFVEQGNGA